MIKFHLSQIYIEYIGVYISQEKISAPKNHIHINPPQGHSLLTSEKIILGNL